MRTFCDSKKHPNVVLTNLNKNCSSRDWAYCITLGCSSFSSGVHFWEVVVEKCGDPDNLAVGVATPDIEQKLGEYYSHPGVAVAYVNGNGHSKLLPNCPPFTVKMRIGMLLNLEENSLSVFQNGSFWGKCDVPVGTYWPIFAALTSDEELRLVQDPDIPVLPS